MHSTTGLAWTTAVVALLVAQTGCESQEARNRALVGELFEAIERTDVAKLDELYADDIVLWTAGGLPISGNRTKDQALEGMRMIGSMFPDGIEFTILAMTAEGDRVAIEATSNAVHVSGLPYHNQYHFLMVARDGKIVSFKEYMDTLHAQEVLMTPPANTEASEAVTSP